MGKRKEKAEWRNTDRVSITFALRVFVLYKLYYTYIRIFMHINYCIYTRICTYSATFKKKKGHQHTVTLPEYVYNYDLKSDFGVRRDGCFISF